MIFAGTALTRAPLTSDRRMLDELVDVGRDLERCSTAPRSAWRSRTPRRASATRRATAGSSVLVTDGVNNAGEIDPVAAAALCEGLGIRVYTIGVGTEADGAPLGHPPPTR